MDPHVHVSALNLTKTALYVIVLLGVLHIIARRYEGHPFANMLLNAYC